MHLNSATQRVRGGAQPECFTFESSTHPLESFLKVASKPAAAMATAFLAKRKSATSAAALETIDEFLLEELRRLAALPAMPADGSVASQFVCEWKEFAQGEEWKAFARRASLKDVKLAWMQWSAFGGECDRAVPLVASLNCEEAVANVAKTGVVRLNGVLSEATAVELRRFIMEQRDQTVALAAKDATAAARELSRVLSPRDGDNEKVTRWDIRLPWVAPVEAAVREMLRVDDLLGDSLHTLSGGDEAELVECAAIISAEGAAPQMLHSDTIPSDGPQLLTAFVALQEVAPHMGPTRFLPCTHAGPFSTSAQRAAARNEPGFCEQAESVSALHMNVGDCTLYDSRLLHCGGPHRSPHPPTPSSERVLFYVSFRYVGANTQSARAENSILPAVAELNIRLRELRS